MFERLGTQWALTLLAFLALAFMPVPFLFYFYGDRIRARSTFAPGHKAAAPTPTPAPASKAASVVDAPVSGTTTVAPSEHSITREMQEELDQGEAIDQADEIQQEKKNGTYQPKSQV
jgi:uncharacterized iron-regulated membrane protein